MNLNGLVSALVPYAQGAIEEANRRGIRPTVTSVFRTRQQQGRLYQNFLRCRSAGLEGEPVSLGRGLSCAWPANPPGQSAHQYGLAWDSWAEELDAWTEIRRSWGWQVPENDKIHAEVPGWRGLIGS